LRATAADVQALADTLAQEAENLESEVRRFSTTCRPRSFPPLPAEYPLPSGA
jgi:hypothetical protein